MDRKTLDAGHERDRLSRSRTPCALLLLFAAWLVSLPLACFPGSYPLELARILAVFLDLGGHLAPVDDLARHIVLDLRLCRVLLAALVGGALALAGLLLQAVLKNSLADPFTLGISQGAACGASLLLASNFPLLTYITGLSLLPQTELVAFAAFLGALSATCATVLLSSGHGLFEHSRVILAGIAVATFLGALVALIKALNEESVASIVFWIMGSFQGRSWVHLPFIALSFVPALLLLLFSWRSLDLFFLEDANAKELGLIVGRTRLGILIASSLLTAGSVAIAGIIGFVGLVVPHVLRLLLGPSHGPLIPASFFGGGLLLIWADVFSRSALPDGQEIPVGVVTALLGGPFFAYLIRKKT